MKKYVYLHKKAVSISMSTHAIAFIFIEGHKGNCYVLVGRNMFYYTSLTLEMFYLANALFITKGNK